MAMQIVVEDGDITKSPADTLIAFINSSGLWFGGIDRAIMHAAGSQFHSVAGRALKRNSATQVVVAKGSSPSRMVADKVIFVIDDLVDELETLVLRGLNVANNECSKRVAMPMLRCDVMAGLGGSIEEKAADIASAAKSWATRSDNQIDQLTIVVYNDPKLSATMREALKK